MTITEITDSINKKLTELNVEPRHDCWNGRLKYYIIFTKDNYYEFDSIKVNDKFIFEEDKEIMIFDKEGNVFSYTPYYFMKFLEGLRT